MKEEPKQPQNGMYEPMRFLINMNIPSILISNRTTATHPRRVCRPFTVLMTRQGNKNTWPRVNNPLL